jgi:hypothetical protein
MAAYDTPPAGASYAAIRRIVPILSGIIGGFSSSPRNRLALVFFSFFAAITRMMFPDLHLVIATRNERKTWASRFLGDAESSQTRRYCYFQSTNGEVGMGNSRGHGHQFKFRAFLEFINLASSKGYIIGSNYFPQYI